MILERVWSVRTAAAARVSFYVQYNNLLERSSVDKGRVRALSAQRLRFPLTLGKRIDRLISRTRETGEDPRAVFFVASHPDRLGKTHILGSRRARGGLVGKDKLADAKLVELAGSLLEKHFGCVREGGGGYRRDMEGGRQAGRERSRALERHETRECREKGIGRQMEGRQRWGGPGRRDQESIY